MSMQQLFIVAYHYREGLDGDDLRELTKKFVEVGNAPGTLAHYTRLDGRGGFVLRKDEGDAARASPSTTRHGWSSSSSR